LGLPQAWGNAVIELSLDGEIIAGEGVGDLRLDMHVGEFLPAIEAAGPWAVKTYAHFPRALIYEYEASLRLHVDVVTGRLFRIDAIGDYEGTYAGRIRVGSLLVEALPLCDLRIDDGLVAGDGGNILFELSEEIDDLESSLDEPILCITLEKRDWMED
jgi:hypothetical protein